MLARKIALNSIISAVVRIAGTLVTLIAIALVTRYLTKNEWGEYSIVLAFGGIFAVLADLGLYQIMLKEISRDGADEQKIVNNIFTLRLTSSLFIFALAPVASLFLPYSNLTRWGIALGMIGFWFLTDIQVLVGIFQKYLRMEKIALGEFLGKVVQLILVFWFIKLGLSFLWLVGAIVFGALVNFLLAWFLLKGHIRLKLAFDFPFWKEIWWKSYPLALSNILVIIYFSANAIIISIFWPPQDVGIFRLSYKVLESLIFFPAMFVGLIMPLLSQAAFLNWPKFKNIFQRAYDILLIFACPLVFGGIVLAPQIIELLGGSQYQESIGILKILMIPVGFIFVSTLLSFGLIALEKQKTLLKISAWAMIINLVLSLILIPKFSYLAAAWITLFTEGLAMVLMFWALGQFLRFSPSFKTGFKSLIAAFLMGVIIWQFNQQNIAVLLLAGAAIYFLALYLLRGISLKEIEELFKKETSIS